MITKLILDIICFLPNSLLDSLGDVSISIPDGVFDGLNSIFNLLGYAFPISGLLVILILSFTIKTFQITWSLIIRIKSFIPTMGD